MAPSSQELEPPANPGRFSSFQPPNMSVLVLVVDDEPDVAELFRQKFRRDLREQRFLMDFAISAKDALARIASIIEQPLILILSDINMPGMTGLEMLPKVRELRPDVPVIMITAYGDPETRRKANEGGAEGLLPSQQTLGMLNLNRRSSCTWISSALPRLSFKGGESALRKPAISGAADIAHSEQIAHLAVLRGFQQLLTARYSPRLVWGWLLWRGGAGHGILNLIEHLLFLFKPIPCLLGSACLIAFSGAHAADLPRIVECGRILDASARCAVPDLFCIPGTRSFCKLGCWMLMGLDPQRKCAREESVAAPLARHRWRGGGGPRSLITWVVLRQGRLLRRDRAFQRKKKKKKGGGGGGDPQTSSIASTSCGTTESRPNLPGTAPPVVFRC